MENKSYSQKVDEWLFAKSGCHAIDFCRKFGYYSLALKIMALDENDEKKSKAIMAKDAELKNHYIRCSKDPQSIARKGANRSWTRYFKDLITGWVVEDLCMTMLKQQGLEIVHNGHDAQRRIAIGNDVTQEADFCIKVGEVVRKVEMSNEFNHFLTKDGFIEKRVPALFRLWQNKGIWIYRDLRNGKYVLIDFGTEKIKLHLRRHNNVMADWAKDVHRYVLEENGKKIRDDRMLAAEIISVVGCSIDGKEQPQLEEVIDGDSPPQDYDVGGMKKAPSDATAKKEVKKATVQKETAKTMEVSPKPKQSAQPKYTPQATPSPPMASIKDDDEVESQSWAGVDLGDDDFV